MKGLKSKLEHFNGHTCMLYVLGRLAYIEVAYISRNFKSLVVCSVFQCAGFAWGYYIQQFGAVVLILFAGCIVSSLVSVHGSFGKLNS